MNCTNCGAYNQDGSTVCSSCGANLTQQNSYNTQSQQSQYGYQQPQQPAYGYQAAPAANVPQSDFSMLDDDDQLPF